jgi:hypothetical protein
MSSSAAISRLDQAKAQVYFSLNEHAPKQEKILVDINAITQQITHDINSRYYALQCGKVSFPSKNELEDEYAAYCLVGGKIRSLFIETNRFVELLGAGLRYLRVKSATEVNADQLSALNIKRAALKRMLNSFDTEYCAMKSSLHYFQFLVNKGKPLSLCQCLSKAVCSQYFNLSEQASSFKDRENSLKERIRAIENRVTEGQGMPESSLENEKDHKHSNDVEKTSSTEPIDNPEREKNKDL